MVLLAAFLSTLSAFAGVPESYLFDYEGASWAPVEQKQVRILGSGLESRKSDRKLTLACVDQTPDCKNFRFIYLEKKPNAQQESAYWLGPNFTSPSEKALKKSFKALIKKAKDGRRKNFKAGLGYGTVIAGMVGYGITSNLALPGVGFLLGLVFLSSVGHQEIDIAKSLFDFLAIDQIQMTSFEDTSGWNWSQKSKRMNENVFKEIVSIIQQRELKADLQTQYFQCQIRQPYFCNPNSTHPECRIYPVVGRNSDHLNTVVTLSTHSSREEADAEIQRLISIGVCIAHKGFE